MPLQSKPGKYTFTFEAPYKLIETGAKGKKPLIVYLHGYKQNIEYFEKKCKDLLSAKAYHLFIQGPYPVYDEARARPVEKWGRAWYLYDGNQEQFAASMEKISTIIENIIKKISKAITVNRLAILGYSMGGYLAGYFALSRSQMVDDLIVIGGRIKNEMFIDKSFKNLSVLHLHGKNDRSVSSKPARESCEMLLEQGADVTFKEIEAGHRLSNNFVKEVRKWMLEKDYKFNRNA